ELEPGAELVGTQPARHDRQRPRAAARGRAREGAPRYGDARVRPLMVYDVKIRGGLVVDGTGSPGRFGDVGIAEGRVVAVGDAPDDATRTIDASGCVVAPGVIDVHTHLDAQVLWDPRMGISPDHGVTSVVFGNCGFSVA